MGLHNEGVWLDHNKGGHYSRRFVSMMYFIVSSNICFLLSFLILYSFLVLFLNNNVCVLARAELQTF